jgi:hypothetical protein
MNMAGDATGKTRSMLFEEKTAAAAMALLSCRIKKYGIPRALYRGRKDACVTNREPAVEEQLAGEEPRSRFEAVSFERRLFQILKDSRPLPRPGAKVTARVRLDRSLVIYYRDKKRSVKEIKPGERKEAA